MAEAIFDHDRRDSDRLSISTPANLVLAVDYEHEHRDAEHESEPEFNLTLAGI